MGENCRDFQDPEEILSPTSDPPGPINFAFPECLEARVLRGINLSKVTIKTMRKDFALSDLIVGPKSMRKKVLRGAAISTWRYCCIKVLTNRDKKLEPDLERFIVPRNAHSLGARVNHRHES